MATSVSMLGARWTSPLKPLTKNFWLMTMTTMVSSISNIISARWLFSKKGGSGHRQSIQPMMYMSGSQKMMEAMSRRTILGVSVSFSSSAARAASRRAPFSAAP